MAQHDLPSAARRFWQVRTPLLSRQILLTCPLTTPQQRTHAPDYLTLIALAVGYLLIQTLITPFHRLFSPTNLSISFPHAEVERVPVAFLFVYAGALPLAILAAWALILRPGAHKAHVTILGLLMSLVLTSFLTDVFKNAVGRPRPDLLARCMVRAGWDKEPGHPVLVGVEVCTQTNHHKLQDGWRSFPSGHSSFAFAGLGYMAMYDYTTLHFALGTRIDLLTETGSSPANYTSSAHSPISHASSWRSPRWSAPRSLPSRAARTTGTTSTTSRSARCWGSSSRTSFIGNITRRCVPRAAMCRTRRSRRIIMAMAS